MTILRYNLFRARQLMDWRLRLSDRTVRKFAELAIYCQRQKRSPGNVVSGSIRLMQIFAGSSLESGRQMRVIFTLFVHCFPNILHTWPQDSFQVIRLSMTLGIFQGRWTVSHQISQKGHFSLGCHFHVHFSNPWHAFASLGLPAIAELLVLLLIPIADTHAESYL